MDLHCSMYFCSNQSFSSSNSSTLMWCITPMSRVQGHVYGKQSYFDLTTVYYSIDGNLQQLISYEKALPRSAYPKSDIQIRYLIPLTQFLLCVPVRRSRWNKVDCLIGLYDMCWDLSNDYGHVCDFMDELYIVYILCIYVHIHMN